MQRISCALRNRFSRPPAASGWLLRGGLLLAAGASAVWLVKVIQARRRDRSEADGRFSLPEPRHDRMGTLLTTNEPDLVREVARPHIKMTEAEPSKDWEFPVAEESLLSTSPSDPVIVDQHTRDPEEDHVGGAPGERKGDRQPFGEVTSIMDQQAATPDFAQQR